MCLRTFRLLYLFFFFSSRRRHTRYIGDWSSDVRSSDLVAEWPEALDLKRIITTFRCRWASWCSCQPRGRHRQRRCSSPMDSVAANKLLKEPVVVPRSEERRVGKECRYRWVANHIKVKRF